MVAGQSDRGRTSILYDVFDYFEDVREQGGRVFVHYCQGVSRSTLLVIAYLMWREGQSFDDAFQYVEAARGIADPNMGFACQLLQCQKLFRILYGFSISSFTCSLLVSSTLSNDSDMSPLSSKSSDQPMSNSPENVVSNCSSQSYSRSTSLPSIGLNPAECTLVNCW
ncbi:protein-tyrosine-phosphatase MKP1 [Prunus yedoensis var. nudiflora]|uniref:Protein-tyrosine-phosphatase MKP1 n=1 Tax=Prunus yedoensis var. nudiflora TaxID=2094558 RepID=A0A314ZDG9_PRUYE|nr:protein-tyrosine-phosphatase MKP1 [Prunus yedoensis var. nudiflora]